VKLILAILSLVLVSCSSKITLTVVEVLYPYNDTHNMVHVENVKKNYSDVLPMYKTLKAGDQIKQRISKEK
jgi:hypothetical protein